MSRVARHSSEEEIAALEALCERLNGFGADLALEWVDGYMTALLASRRAIPPSEWMPKMLGDSFDRAFGDPASAEAATATLSCSPSFAMSWAAVPAERTSWAPLPILVSTA